ncbi:MAG TPA: glutamate--cysteine ligase [Burkholderiales bacterium]|nr:glutamate--cysteine ligase [Burkholderiales bacterium]
MTQARFQERLRALSPAVLKGLRRGIEKESLRVTATGSLALTPHPPALGSALKHPHITTDFSESQLELITGIHPSAESCLAELERVHQFVYRHIGEEVMWCASMPCGLPAEKDIPIGRYGSSNIGRAKSVYRMGLAHRYGRRMQAISGVHYNFSLPESAWPLPGYGDPNEAYFALIRNFRRTGWLLLYLFGTSPAVCSSFVQGRPHKLQKLSEGTLYLPHATSLRMGRLGYLSEAQDSLAVSYNSLESYAGSLQDALTKPYAPYESIGITSGADYRQLSTSMLQIENEFYSTIRPKRRIRTGERQLHALRERGVEYIEVRAMDLDPFSAIGIAPATCRFLDVYLLHCLLAESPPDTRQEIEAVGRNKQSVAARGREPGLALERGAHKVSLREWGLEVLRECEPIAAALDDARSGTHGKNAHRDALAAATAVIEDPAKAPAARMLAEMHERYEDCYTRFVLERSLAHRRSLLDKPLPAETVERFVRAAEASLAKQREIEAADKIPFETWRQNYLKPEALGLDSRARALS